MIRIATFNLENFDDVARPTLAERITIMRPQLARINADVLCLQEAHSQGPADNRVLSALDSLLQGTDYSGFNRSTTTTTTGVLYDQRNIVTLSRFPILTTTLIRDSDAPRPSYQMVTANPPDQTANPLVWERPILYNTLDLGNNHVLHLMNVHMKSKIASNIPGQKVDNFTWRSVSAWAEGSFIASMKRVGQALQARLAIDTIFDDQGDGALIAICGDFNADSDEVPVRTIRGPVEETGNPEHASRVMVPCESNIPESSRFSLKHLGHGEMIDHILVSRAMLQFFSHAEIHNEVLPDESGAFRTDDKFPESDHAPVIAEFDM